MSYGEMVAGWRSGGAAADEPGAVGDPGVGCCCCCPSPADGCEVGSDGDDVGDVGVKAAAAVAAVVDEVDAVDVAVSLAVLADFDLEEEDFFPDWENDAAEAEAADDDDDDWFWQWHWEKPLKKQTEH